MMIDFLGRIIFFEGPFTGNSYDGHIWNSLEDEHQMEENELLLADGHFTICEHAATPIRQNSVVDEKDRIYNLVLQHYRARIEHVNGYFVRFVHRFLLINFVNILFCFFFNLLRCGAFCCFLFILLDTICSELFIEEVFV